MNLTDWVHVVAWVVAIPAWAVAIYSVVQMGRDYQKYFEMM